MRNVLCSLWLLAVRVATAGRASPSLSGALAAHKAGDSVAALREYHAFVTAVGGAMRAPAAVHSNIGALELARGNRTAAIAAFEQALDVDADHFAAHLNLAIALPPNASTQARRHAAHAVRLRPSSPSAHQALANCEQNAGREAEAQAAWRDAELAAARTSGAADRVRRDHCGYAMAELGAPPVAVQGVTPWSNLRATTRSVSPPIVVFDALLSRDEGAALIALAGPLLERSFVSGGAGSATARDSSTAWLAWESAPALLLLRTRFAALLGLAEHDFAARAEPLQVVRYEAGQRFALHHDSPAAFQRRLLTLLLYLADGADGGATCFPALHLPQRGRGDAAARSSAARAAPPPPRTRAAASADVSAALALGGCAPSSAGASARAGGPRLAGDAHSTSSGRDAPLLVRPRAGRGVLFYNLDADGLADPRVVHAGLAPAHAVKWIANVWLAPPRTGSGAEEVARAQAE
jgi:tetratricopeptide (TPR) repeat protein